MKRMTCKRETLTCKNQFLSWVGANNCVKDKIMGNYIIQMMRVDVTKTKPRQPKVNHYKFMKQKVKSTYAKNGNETFQYCLAKWDEEEDMEEKITTPLSVLEHYKKYMIEE